MNWFTKDDWTALGFISACLIIWAPVVWRWL